MKANILGTIYKIKRKTLKDANTDGWCDDTSKTIVIRNDNYKNVGNFEYLMKKQLRHEIIHAYLSESGLQSNFENCTQWGHNETMVDWIVIQFPKIYKTYVASLLKRIEALEALTTKTDTTKTDTSTTVTE
jgi:hypothetical protein